MSIANKSPTPVVVLDGGLGTTLSLPPYNITFDKTTPLWSSHLLINPLSLDTLSSIQKSFVQAGAEILLTDTYQASYQGFERTPGWNGDREDAQKCMRNAVKIGRDAFGRNKGMVALSLGPYGATMIPGQEYSGEYDEDHREVEDLTTWHLERLKIFLPDEHAVEDDEKKEREECSKDVDMIAFETVPLLKEVQAVRKVMASLPEQGRMAFWIACVFPGEGESMPDGSSVEELVKTSLQEKSGEAIPSFIGLNCTKITKVESLVERFERAVGNLIDQGVVKDWPGLVLYPDGTDGEVYNTSTMIWEQKESSNELPWDQILFDIVAKARSRGLWKNILVGGCCKTTPVHIQKLRNRIDDLVS